MLHAFQVANIRNKALLYSSGGAVIHALCRTINQHKYNHYQRFTAQAKLDTLCFSCMVQPLVYFSLRSSCYFKLLVMLLHA